MAFAPKIYRWSWQFRSPPESLWPLVSNTDRFNRDCGLPPARARPPVPGEPRTEPGVRRQESSVLGVAVEWEEREFEWVQPVRFGVRRIFTKGPMAELVQSCELAPGPTGGTALVYELRITPGNLLGALILPIAIGSKLRRNAERVLRTYDQAALQGHVVAAPARPMTHSVATNQRLQILSAKLVSEAGQPADLVGRLSRHVSSADDLYAAKMRPYELADTWETGRDATLDLFLHATRAGLLDFSWEVLCPHCRGAKEGKPELSGVPSEAHCDTCGIDFTVNFDQSVELTFAPNPAVRRVARLAYCVGGPQITPHVVAQKRLGPMENLYVAMSFPEGRYRVRSEGQALQQAFRIERGGASTARMEIGAASAPAEEPVLAPDSILNILNPGPAERLAVIERIAWSDQAVTAAAVTSRQIFRDLFAREILRPGERISVGAIAIVFTDLKNSTQLYQEIGDAPAFGRVLTHFDTLMAAVAAEGGAVVKTMGDAVMAAFIHPASALRAMRRAQGELAAPAAGRLPLALKCSVHQGSCLAINQNDRLDYFGMTVNVAARLCALSTGDDIVVSAPVRHDPDVAALLAGAPGVLTERPDSAVLRGLGGEAFDFWRLKG